MSGLEQNPDKEVNLWLSSMELFIAKPAAGIVAGYLSGQCLFCGVPSVAMWQHLLRVTGILFVAMDACISRTVPKVETMMELQQKGRKMMIYNVECFRSINLQVEALSEKGAIKKAAKEMKNIHGDEALALYQSSEDYIGDVSISLPSSTEWISICGSDGETKEFVCETIDSQLYRAGMDNDIMVHKDDFEEVKNTLEAHGATVYIQRVIVALEDDE